MSGIYLAGSDFLMVHLGTKLGLSMCNPPANKASRKVANFIKRKNLAKDLWLSLSVCLFVCSEIWPQLSHYWQNSYPDLHYL